MRSIIRLIDFENRITTTCNHIKSNAPLLTGLERTQAQEVADPATAKSTAGCRDLAGSTATAATAVLATGIVAGSCLSTGSTGRLPPCTRKAKRGEAKGVSRRLRSTTRRCELRISVRPLLSSPASSLCLLLPSPCPCLLYAMRSD